MHHQIALYNIHKHKVFKRMVMWMRMMMIMITTTTNIIINNAKIYILLKKLSMYIFVFFGDGDTICTRQEV